MTITFHNKASRKLEVTTYSSYPIIPGWIENSEWCVEPDSHRQTSIKFNFDDPDISIHVLDNLCGDAPHSHHSAMITFGFVKFFEGKAEIKSDVSVAGNQLEFCATTQFGHRRKCEKLK